MVFKRWAISTVNTEKEKRVTEKKESKGFFGRKKKENAEDNPVEK